MIDTSSKPNIPASKITEEVFNSSIHGLAAIAGVIGIVLGLLTMSGGAASKVAFVTYGVCLVLLMTMSSLYHALIFSRARRVFQIFDHSAILLLIAGSYTPFILFLFDGWRLYAMLALVWSIAITGIVLKSATPKLMKKIGVGLYIAFGWLAILFIPRFGALGTTVTVLLVLGGVFYTLGAGIMAFKKPFTHMGWHLMVVLAAATHFFAIIQLS